MELPKTIAVLTLEQTVLFPQMFLPLRLTTLADRQLLDAALAGCRQFAVCGADVDGQPLPVGTVSLIRACVKRRDGSAHLLLQGLQRVRCEKLFIAAPFLTATVSALRPRPPADAQAARRLAGKIIRLANRLLPRPWQHSLWEFDSAADGRADYDRLVDIFAGHLVHEQRQQQWLLECEDTQQRLALLADSPQAECAHFDQ